ncbi:hypothetical protein JI58_05035 [Marinosulfonomonas sp. PRT-SC04]|nr:hypothetical protein JI58_05035 [Marinosulfonomonas sp. PRT-SC04]
MDTSDMRRPAKLAPVAVSDIFSRRIAFLFSERQNCAPKLSPAGKGIRANLRSFDPIGLFIRKQLFFCRASGTAKLYISNSAAVAQVALRLNIRAMGG